jgi:hypothetical protein
MAEGLFVAEPKLNALSPMLATLLGMMTLFKLLQPVNAAGAGPTEDHAVASARRAAGIIQAAGKNAGLIGQTGSRAGLVPGD